MSTRGRSDVMINNANAFALLGKKKTKGNSLAAKSGNEKKAVDEKVFWAPAPLNTKSWADVDDEDDDDYYATTAPPVAVWGSSEEQAKEESLVPFDEEMESDEDILRDDESDLDEEHTSEHEIQETPEPVGKPIPPVIVIKEPERQLSKKEIKKKEQEAFDAALAELNITPNDKNGHVEHQVKKKESQPTGEGEKDESGTAEPKNSKKKKKKAKTSAKEVKEIQHNEEANAEKAEEDAATVDVKEQLKKLASMKKKKPSRETDTAAKAAAAEAAARRQKLEAAKKKEKSHHYNQQPVR